ncbi:fatty acyl-AMP ligase [Gloeobacter morelensis]|uniref:Fatty acyl-AMP ligase n=1 Tax=Gloeobacter morelensis MG652769 TaxID=2781736 RepID=A0ABY3PM10_9CYAN|nr:fatty acyl-AMP ligase [Gloeobacter morelensis MG652769]
MTKSLGKPQRSTATRTADNLVEALRRWSCVRSARNAYTWEGETAGAVRLTFFEIDRLARTIAARLQQSHLRGGRAVLLYPPGLEFVAAFMGCLYAGVTAVPAHSPRPRRPAPKLQAILADAGVRAVLTTAASLARSDQWTTENPQLAGLQWLATDNLDTDLADTWQECTFSKDSLAFLQYTSGSTGHPKGVMITHGNLLHNQRMVEGAFGHSDETIFAGWLPLFHDMGLIGNVLQPLHLGIPCVLMSPVDFVQKPRRWLEAITRHRATTSGGPNFAYDLCVRKVSAEQREGLDLSSWRVAFNGAEPVRAHTLQAFAAAFAGCGFRAQAFYPCYGLAEATLFVTGGLFQTPAVVCSVAAAALEQDRVVPAAEDDPGSRLLVGCGRPWLGQEVVIADPTHWTLCPPGQVGEIWVAGPSVARGYWNRPAESAATFGARLADTGAGPFLRTGDLGFIQGGELFVTGRLKDLIIIRGANHYPQDIEASVENCHRALRPGCGAAFAVEFDGEERLVVVQELERQLPQSLDFEEVLGSIRQAVAARHGLHVDTAALIKTGSIPKTSSGKIQRRTCRSRFLDGTLPVLYAGGRSPMPPAGRPSV